MMDDSDWQLFKQRLKIKTDIDLDFYKEPQMRRRIGNLVTRNNENSYSAYFAKVVRKKEDLDKFVEYLTINVSEFFRTPQKFAELENKIIPELLTRSTKLNIWSAGSSIGAEAYSLAMLLNEQTPFVSHRILATDIDSEALTKAKEACYVEQELGSITAERLKKYFDKAMDDKWCVKDFIKKRVEFCKHNLLKDEFEEGFDLILCRNVVIYFTEEAKKQLYSKFYNALKPGGVLFVGATEAILEFRKIGFTSPQPFFYQKPLQKDSV